MATSSVLDHTQDLSGTEQHRLTRLFPEPDYVKQADYAQLYGDTEQLPPDVFAWPGKRLYRCHTKAATWMSALFFGDKAENVPEPHRAAAKAHILKHAVFHGIGPEVSALFNKVAQAKQAKAIPDEDYAFVWTDRKGQVHRNYPLRNAAEVKAAAAWFQRFRTRPELEYSMRKTIASRILEKAAEFRVPLDSQDSLARSAGYGYSPATTIAEAWERRASLVQQAQPATAAAAVKLAQSIREHTKHCRANSELRDKMAAELDRFDASTGLVKQYANGLVMPEDVVYALTEKLASEFAHDHVQLVTGVIYKRAELAALPLETLREWMGDDIAKAVEDKLGDVDGEKLAEMLTILPRPDALTFQQLAQSRQIAPVLTEKVAEDSLFSEEDFKNLRSMYQDIRRECGIV